MAIRRRHFHENDMTPGTAATGFIALCCAASALAQQAAYPTRPVRIIVGFAAGGITHQYVAGFLAHTARHFPTMRLNQRLRLFAGERR